MEHEITVTIDKEVLEKARVHAEENGTTVEDMVKEYLIELLSGNDDSSDSNLS